MLNRFTTRPKYVNYILFSVKLLNQTFESNMLFSICYSHFFFRLTITSIWMFAFVPTSPITKKRNEISDQYLNHVNNIIFGLKKVWKRSDYLLIESKIKLLFCIMNEIDVWTFCFRRFCKNFS